MKQIQDESKRNICKDIGSIVISIIISILVYFICTIAVRKIDIDYENNLKSISNMFERLSNFFSVMIGVYIAVLVFLATARTPILHVLHKKRIVKSFSKVVKLSILYGGLFVLLEVFMPYNCNINMAIMCAVAFMGLVYAIYFIAIVIKMFDYNIVELEKESINQNTKTEDFITLVEKIEKNTRK